MRTRLRLSVSSALCLLLALALLPTTGMGIASADGQSVLVVDEDAGSASFVPGEIIVKFRPGIPERAIQAINAEHGASIHEVSPLGLMRVTIPEGRSVLGMAQLYSKNPNVEYAEPNAVCNAVMSPNDPYYMYQWHLDNDDYGGINAEDAWDISTGEGVVVAVIDTGVAYENYGSYLVAPDLAGTTFVQGWDYVNNDAHPNDDHWHGTHVTGTIAQNTNNGYGPAGVAFGASIMPLKVLDASGSGTAMDLANAIYYAAINGAQVMNMSLAFPVWYPGSLLTSVHDAIQFAAEVGVTVVAAAGNDGANQVAYPAAFEECIAVGATQYDETITQYTNIGVALDLVAPGGNLDNDQNGDGVKDGVLQETINPNLGPAHFGFFLAEGTSMASPHVAGVAALVIAAAGGDLPGAEVRQILESTAEDLGSSGWDMAYGWGMADAYAAVSAALEPSNAAPVASDDSAATSEETPVTIDVLANDSDPDGDALTVESFTQGAGGSVGINVDDTVTYTPAPGFSGADSFTYTASDGNGGTDTATVTLAVTPAAPTAYVDIAISAKVQRTKWQVAVKVTITEVEAGGPAIEGATVEGRWDGAYTGEVSGTTDRKGTVKFNTPRMTGGETVTFTVLGVVKDGQEYDVTGEHSNTISR